MNLVVNAVDAMPAGGELKIETSNVESDARLKKIFPSAGPGSYILIAISDTGCGMDSATMARIFEPFFTTKPVGKGTGMGLSTVFGIIKEHGAHIAVESAESRGTTFLLLFPRVTEVLEPWCVNSEPDRIPCGWETVLVVDDEVSVRKLVGRVLKVQGYTVIEAEDAKQALELCKSHSDPIDLLVTDVVMPGTSGPKLAEEIASLEPAARVLYISGYNDRILERQGEADLVGACLRKPFTTVELLRAVRERLDME
jgi:CheY-like chemotaxis protein